MYEYQSTTTTYDQALSNLNQIREDILIKEKKSIRMLYVIAIIILFISVGIFYLIDAYSFVYLFPGIMIPIITGLIHIGIKYNNKKVFINKHINSEIIKLFNAEFDTNFTYEYKVKVPKEFNQKMGLFPRGSSIFTNYRITGVTPENHPIIILDCRMVTSNGKSSTIHFDGIYAILQVSFPVHAQVRSSGRPHVKGIQFNKLDNYEQKVFLAEDTGETLPSELLHLYREIKDNFTTRGQYIGTNTTELHIAIWDKEKNPLPEELNYQTLESYAHPLMNYLSYIIQTASRLEETY